MADPTVAVYETATEFFGFTPVSFVDDVVNAVNHYVYQAVESLQAFLTSRKVPESATIEDIERVRALPAPRVETPPAPVPNLPRVRRTSDADRARTRS